MKKALSTLTAILCISQFLHCTTTIDPPPPPLENYSSSAEETGGITPSSSSLSVGKVLCLYSGGCTTITPEDCPAIGGQIVQSCPTASSSSSSGCVGSGSYCNYGGCLDWELIDGVEFRCLQHVNGWANQGGCYPMPTKDNCASGTIVSVCPANAIPPTVDYCKLPSSSSNATLNSSSTVAQSSAGGANQQIIFSESEEATIDFQNDECVDLEINWTNEHYTPRIIMLCEAMFFSRSSRSLSISVGNKIMASFSTDSSGDFIMGDINLISEISVGTTKINDICMSFTGTTDLRYAECKLFHS